MNNIVVLVSVLVFCVLMAIVQYVSSLQYYPEKDSIRLVKNAPWQWTVVEIWNRFITLFLGGLVGYYFVSVRWEQLFKGETLNLGDFVMFLIFSMCMLGWFPILLKNLTLGITAIFERILSK